MRYIKEFGIERSGTVYLEQMINFNIKDCSCFTNGFGWKHGRIKNPVNWLKQSKETEDWHREVYNETPGGILTVIICKDPYHWAKSISRYINNSPKQAIKNLKDPYKRFNDIYLHWYDRLILHQNIWFSDCIGIKYEDLLKEPETILKIIADRVGCELNQEIIIPSKVYMSSEFTQERKDYYLTENALSQEEIDKINSKISDRFFELYKYERR
jgi:hypothetical protein